MSGAPPVTAPRATSAPVAAPRATAAMAVVRAMNRELNRQVREGTLVSAHGVDINGHVTIEGRLDLAMLAFVAELVLRAEFPSLEALR